MFLALELALFDYVKGKIILFLASHHSSGLEPSNNVQNQKENVKNVVNVRKLLQIYLSLSQIICFGYFLIPSHFHQNCLFSSYVFCYDNLI